MSKAKSGILTVFVIAFGSYFILDLGQFLALEYVQSQLNTIQDYKNQNFTVAALAYFAIYIVVAALSIPGAEILTLIGGAIFGLFWGTF